MQTSSPRFKSLAVTAGLSLWFFIFTNGVGVFTIEYLAVFVGVVLAVTQVFAKKISKGLDVFAIINTKIFLGILFVFVIAIYGILFRFLRVDLLRLKKQNDSYWLEIESNDVRKMF
jgi:hypothetical protein